MHKVPLRPINMSEYRAACKCAERVGWTQRRSAKRRPYDAHLMPISLFPCRVAILNKAGRLHRFGRAADERVSCCREHSLVSTRCWEAYPNHCDQDRRGVELRENSTPRLATAKMRSRIPTLSTCVNDIRLRAAAAMASLSVQRQMLW